MKGQCLCGLVSITVADHTDIEVCHCHMCRRWGGGPYFSIPCKEIEVEGEKHVVHYRSSEWAARAFCQNCGSHLYYCFQAGGFYALSAGLFQEEPALKLRGQIFIDKKPGYYSLAEQTRTMTEQEVLEMFMKWSGP